MILLFFGFSLLLLLFLRNPLTPKQVRSELLRSRKEVSYISSLDHAVDFARRLGLKEPFQDYVVCYDHEYENIFGVAPTKSYSGAALDLNHRKSLYLRINDDDDGTSSFYHFPYLMGAGLLIRAIEREARRRAETREALRTWVPLFVVSLSTLLAAVLPVLLTSSK